MLKNNALADEMSAYKCHYVPILVSLLLLTGCAFTSIDPDGTRHITGIVHLKIPPESKGQVVRGHVVYITSFGFTFLKSKYDNALTLGYQNLGTVVLGNNACAIIDDLSRN